MSLGVFFFQRFNFSSSAITLTLVYINHRLASLNIFLKCCAGRNPKSMILLLKLFPYTTQNNTVTLSIHASHFKFQTSSVVPDTAVLCNQCALYKTFTFTFVVT